MSDQSKAFDKPTKDAAAYAHRKIKRGTMHRRPKPENVQQGSDFLSSGKRGGGTDDSGG